MGKEKRSLYLLKSVFGIVLCFTAYACSVTNPAALRQTDGSSFESKISENSSSEKNLLIAQNQQNPAQTTIAKPSETASASCEVKKSDDLQQDKDFEAKTREIIAYIQKKNSKIADQAKVSKASVRSEKADADTEMVSESKNIAEDAEYVHETPDVSENITVSDNEVGEAEFYIRYSKSMDIKPDGDVDQQLLDSIGKWFGSPYRMGGCSKGGVDCSCFVKTIYEDVYGIELSRSSRSMYERTNQVRKNQLQEGDLVYFKIRGKRISHVGIYLGNNKFVHSSRKKGVVINDLNHPYYKKRFVSGGRVNEHVGLAESSDKQSGKD